MSLDEGAKPGPLAFDDFVLDPAERRLSRAGAPVEISGRYLDALQLMVRERGSLVTKDRFMDEVWRGVPVTDEALTQCIRSLRRALGDDASRPRFIETVPKHGYRFIAPVGGAGPAAAPRAPIAMASWLRMASLAAAGTAGAGAAGVIGGVLYGSAAAQGADGGAASVLIVVVMVTLVVALLGGAGVSLGVAGARALAGNSLPATALGGAAGGLVIGALFRLFGLDALNLLFGRAPEGITGAGEGVLLGLAGGIGIWLALRPGRDGLMRRMVTAGWIGAVAGVAVVAAGGRMLGGSLALLAERFPDSRLRLDAIGRLFGEDGYGAISQLVTGAGEGALFVAGLAGAIAWACRRFDFEPGHSSKEASA